MKIFFVIGGLVLIVSGVAQALVRPTTAGESWLARVANRATVRAVVFCAAGLLALLAGLGVLPLPLPPQP